MLHQISLAWRNVKNNRRTIGLLSLDNWRGVNLWCNKNELSTLDCSQLFACTHKMQLSGLSVETGDSNII